MQHCRSPDSGYIHESTTGAHGGATGARAGARTTVVAYDDTTGYADQTATRTGGGAGAGVGARTGVGNGTSVGFGATSGNRVADHIGVVFEGLAAATKCITGAGSTSAGAAGADATSAGDGECSSGAAVRCRKGTTVSAIGGRDSYTHGTEQIAASVGHDKGQPDRRSYRLRGDAIPRRYMRYRR